MRLNRITIKGEFAHFKVPAKAKIQQTYEIPPISTVVGILQNIYGKDIDNFTFGYTISHKGKTREVMKLYKEINPLEKALTDKKRFTSDIATIEYLYDVELVIYTSINQTILLEDVLVLGKANNLGTITEIKEIDLVEKDGYGYSQYTSKNIGDGQIRRINTLTEFNENTDKYDIKSALVRENREFEYDKNYDEELEQNIYLWNWNGGEISEIN